MTPTRCHDNLKQKNQTNQNKKKQPKVPRIYVKKKIKREREINTFADNNFPNCEESEVFQTYLAHKSHEYLVFFNFTPAIATSQTQVSVVFNLNTYIYIYKKIIKPTDVVFLFSCMTCSVWTHFRRCLSSSLFMFYLYVPLASDISFHVLIMPDK